MGGRGDVGGILHAGGVGGRGVMLVGCNAGRDAVVSGGGRACRRGREGAWGWLEWLLVGHC
jgi:hypothetical protein